jgi:hypothetical protein
MSKLDVNLERMPLVSYEAHMHGWVITLVSAILIVTTFGGDVYVDIPYITIY